jgi:hypothetical protein
LPHDAASRELQQALAAKGLKLQPLWSDAADDSAELRIVQVIAEP